MRTNVSIEEMTVCSPRPRQIWPEFEVVAVDEPPSRSYWVEGIANLKRGAYRFFFFSSDRGEPIHVHVERELKTAKFGLDPVRMEYRLGFAPTELNKVAKLA